MVQYSSTGSTHTKFSTRTSHGRTLALDARSDARSAMQSIMQSPNPAIQRQAATAGMKPHIISCADGVASPAAASPHVRTSIVF